MKMLLYVLWEASVWMNLGIKLGLIMIDGEKTVFLQKRI